MKVAEHHPTETGSLRDYARSELLQFGSIEALKALASSDARRKVLRAVGYLLWLVGETLYRTGWILLAAVVVTVKAVLLLPGVLVYFPVASLAQRIRRQEGPVASVWSGFCGWAGARDLFGLRFVSAIWDDLLAFDTAHRLGDSLPSGFRKIWHSLKRCLRWTFSGTIPRKVLKAVPGLLATVFLLLLFPLSPVYLLARFLIFLVLGVVGKLLVFTLMLGFMAGLVLLVLLSGLIGPLLSPLVSGFELGFGAVNRGYPILITWALNNRLKVIGLAVAPFLICWFILLPRLGRELIPQVHQGEFNLETALPVGTPLTLTDETTREVEARVMEQADVGRIATVVGVDKTTISSADQGEHTARITILLDERSDNDGEAALIRWAKNAVALPGRIWAGVTGQNELAEREDDLMLRLRRSLAEQAQVRVDFSRPALFTFKTPIEVEIRGYDLGDLARLGRDAERALAAVPGLYDVKSSLQRGSPEVQITYHRDLLASYNLNLSDVASLVREKVQGRVVTQFREADRRIDVRVRVDEADRAGVADLRRLVVNPRGAIPIRLSGVADIQVEEGPSEIRRIDQQRAVLITANVSGVDLGTATGLIKRALEQIDVPADVAFVIGGQNKEMKTSLDSLLFALGLAIFLVYIVMASQFESFVHPFVIIFTIPLALIGVTLVLFAADISLSVVVFLGIIMLAGIVVNNAIVLVDYINHLRASGLTKFDAIAQAGTVRLRPILMTTATTVLGLLPMALGLGEGAEIRTPMAITVVAGLTSATLLTLVVIPTVYSLLDRGE